MRELEQYDVCNILPRFSGFFSPGQSTRRDLFGLRFRPISRDVSQKIKNITLTSPRRSPIRSGAFLSDYILSSTVLCPIFCSRALLDVRCEYSRQDLRVLYQNGRGVLRITVCQGAFGMHIIHLCRSPVPSAHQRQACFFI